MITATPAVIGPGKFAVIPTLVGKNPAGVTQPITGTAKISDYAKAYVCVYGGGGYAVKPKADLGLGETAAFNVTFTMSNAAGTPLEPIVYPFVLSGPPAPPPADHIVYGDSAVLGFDGPPWNVVQDPGSDTISI